MDLIKNRIRFVGGPMHNQLHCVTLHGWYQCARSVKPMKIVDYNPEIIQETLYLKHNYRLKAFVTEYGTRFYQYIHQDLLTNDEPHRSTYDETILSWMQLLIIDHFFTAKMINQGIY